MAEESPLGGAEERMGFHIGRACSGTDTAELIFNQEFADEGLAEAKNIR